MKVKLQLMTFLAMSRVYDSQWWLALVLETDKENAEVKVMFLHHTRTFPLFQVPHSTRYPSCSLE